MISRRNDETGCVFSAVSHHVSTWRLPQEFLGHMKETDTEVPYRHGPYFYYSRSVKGKPYKIHCRSKEQGGKEQVRFSCPASLPLTFVGNIAACLCCAVNGKMFFFVWMHPLCRDGANSCLLVHTRFSVSGEIKPCRSSTSDVGGFKTRTKRSGRASEGCSLADTTHGAKNGVYVRVRQGRQRS